MPNLHFAKLGRENCSDPAEYFLPFQKLGHFVMLGVENQATGGQGIPPTQGRGSQLGYTKPQAETACHPKPGMPHQAAKTQTKEEQKGEENNGESASCSEEHAL